MMFLPLFATVVEMAREFFRSVYVNLVAAAIIVLIGFIIGRWLSRLTDKLLRELNVRTVLKEAGIRLPLERYASKGVAYVVYFTAIIMALQQLKIASVILYIILAAMLLIMVLSFGLSIKDFVPNMTAGFSIYHDSRIRKGEYIETQGIEGTVIAISLTSIKLRTKEGDLVYIPNATLIKKGLIKKEKKRRKV